MDEPVPLEERSAILDAEVMKYARMGYEVRARTQTTAQLVKPKKFSFIWALVWFLLFGIGLIIYLLYYWASASRGSTWRLTSAGGSGAPIPTQVSEITEPYQAPREWFSLPNRVSIILGCSKELPKASLTLTVA